MRNVYLIQRGTINVPLSIENRISQAVNMDYMGSAEFEFGALPKSLRAMQRAADALELRETNITNIEGNNLLVLSSLSDEDFATWCAQFKESCDNKRRLKEMLRIENWFKELKAPEELKGKRKQEYIDRHIRYRSDFWWDIDNGVMTSFNKDFMAQCRQNLESSWKYMDEQVANK